MHGGRLSRTASMVNSALTSTALTELAIAIAQQTHPQSNRRVDHLSDPVKLLIMMKLLGSPER